MLPPFHLMLVFVGTVHGPGGIADKIFINMSLVYIVTTPVKR